MSSQAVAWAIVMQAGGPSAKAVLMSIANYADVYGECWQDQQTLAEGAELGVRQFRTILAALVERGLVVKQRRGGDGKGRKSDLLRLRMREMPVIITAKRKPEAVAEDRQPAISGNRQSLPVAVSECSQPENIAERATGNLEGGNRQLIAATYNPTIPLPSNEGKRARGASPPGFDEAWALWPKHHRQSSKAESLRRWAKLRADPAQLLAAIRAYLASPDATKVTPDGVRGGFVNAFEVWLSRYAEFWLERVGQSDLLSPTAPDWPRREAHFRDTGSWNDAWGPRPDSPEYRGAAA